MSVHLRKLEDAGYLQVTKQFNGRRPQTIYVLTEAGMQAWQAYLIQMNALLSEH
jgi:DNA-binding PadR family transcriptional regulator